MKKAIFTILTLLLSLTSQGQSTNELAQKYIAKYSHIAVSNMKDYGIPASITLAQGMLESGYGESRLSVKANNHFGIKCKASWTGGRVYHDDDLKNECFRKYKHVDDSYADHADFLMSNPRYESLFKLSKTDYKGWAKGLKKAGYATSPIYAEKLIELIENYELYQYDSNKRDKKTKTESIQHTINKDITVKQTTAERVAYTINGRMVYMYGKARYVYAEQGDSFDKISKSVKIGKGKIKRLNKNTVVSQGTKIYLNRHR